MGGGRGYVVQDSEATKMVTAMGEVARALLMPPSVPPPRASAPVERIEGSMHRCGQNTLAVVKVDGLPKVSARLHRVCARPISAIAGRRRRRGPRGGIGGDLLFERLEIGGGRICCGRRLGGGGDGHRQFISARLGRRRSRNAFRPRRLWGGLWLGRW
jgi:hypothetical protein